MGILSALGLVRASGPATPNRHRGIRSPWTQGQLETVVWNDILGGEAQIVTRSQAMRVPAVAKARHILCNHLSRTPLRALQGEDLLAEQPSWLYRTDGVISPWHRMAWTVDDLLFSGWCLWIVARGADRTILTAERMPPEWWRFTAEGDIELMNPVSGGWYLANADDVLLIPGPGEGLLETASGTIRAALGLEKAWSGRVRNPIPATELHQTDDVVLTDDEIDGLIEDYVKARQDPDGAIVYTPYNIEMKTHGEAKADLFENARNAVRIDVANFTGLPGAALDGSLATASLTYVTQDGKRTELADALDLYAGAIAGRLSQDDAVPRGTRVRFDFTDTTQTPTTGPTVED